ncbi:MAG: hypothetical protein COB16_19205 [Rhodobacteraceae bacterium]|nr:MAG: hypothetical protein COB16_19205 [Paracoccaceae bacterium]
MLKDVLAGAGDRHVLVKPHPRASNAEDIDAVIKLARHDSRLVLTDANVHDMLAASCASVSINSTVVLEGFLHRTPAILYGKSDFHHISENVTRLGGFDLALEGALQRSGGYAQYLTWYFRHNCLAIEAQNLESQIWRIFTTAGFGRDRFVR